MPSIRSAPRQPYAWVSAWASERHERAADPDAEVRDAHGLAASSVEPARQEDLVRQRPAADVAERVEEIKEIEPGERRDLRESDERAAGHHDAGEHQPPGTEAVDHPAGDEAEDAARR